MTTQALIDSLPDVVVAGVTTGHTGHSETYKQIFQALLDGQGTSAVAEAFSFTAQVDPADLTSGANFDSSAGTFQSVSLVQTTGLGLTLDPGNGDLIYPTGFWQANLSVVLSFVAPATGELQVSGGVGGSSPFSGGASGMTSSIAAMSGAVLTGAASGYVASLLYSSISVANYTDQDVSTCSVEVSGFRIGSYIGSADTDVYP